MLASPLRRSHLIHLLALLAMGLMGAVPAGNARADAADAHIAPPQDTPYPGTIKLSVDTLNITQGIFRVHEIIPVRPGELTLLYPKWFPAHHSPAGRIDRLAGLTVTANGKPLVWKRYKYDVYAFRMDVPEGVKEIDVKFQFLSTRTHSEGPIRSSNLILDLAWIKVALYPAGYYTRDITFVPSVVIPHGWHFGTALETALHKGDTITFKPTTFNTLCDSPLYAGRYFKRIDLSPDAKPAVHLDIFADAPRYLEMTPDQIKVYRALVTQEYKLFGSHHYDHYDFLLSLSNVVSRHGLEHHQSSEDGAEADYFTDWNGNAAGRDLLPHEFTHSWNGKFRRPADQWTPNFNVPMGDSLLWVYEGQTQYWGYVLTARSGMWSPEQFRDALALVAATYDRDRPGFEWRDIQDTTNDPIIVKNTQPYGSWQMDAEYYSAGQLIWLAVDAKIRSLTHDRKSLDTFAKAFFGVDNGSFVTKTYTFDDLVAALNGVAKYDWTDFLRTRLDAHKPPLDGIAASGWKIIYTDEESPFEKQNSENFYPPISFMLSIGLDIGKDGSIHDVRWNGPAFDAGIGSGETVLAVNGQAYKPDVLKDAIKAAETDKSPIKLLLKYQDQYKTVLMDYHGGLQYPHLVRISGKPDYLDQIIAAKN
ncbi:MAG: M61 family metallopeptidase [Rhodanobacteraceae bacterium]